MGWGIYIFTDKKIDPAHVNALVNSDFEAGPAQFMRKSSNRQTSWGWHSNVDIHEPKKNKIFIGGAFFSYEEAIPSFQKMAKGLERFGYKIKAVSGDEGLDEPLKQMGYPVIDTSNLDSFDSYMLPDTDEDKVDKIIQQMERKVKAGEKISSDQILDLYNVAKQYKSNKLMALVKTLSSKPNEEQQQQLQELVRHIIRQTLKELMGSSYQSTSQIQQPTIDPTQPPVDTMTPAEKARQEREQEKQRRVALKQGEQELKTAKKQQDFYSQNVAQSKRYTIPTLTKKIQSLKGGTIGTAGTSAGL